MEWTLLSEDDDSEDFSEIELKNVSDEENEKIGLAMLNNNQSNPRRMIEILMEQKQLANDMRDFIEP